MFKKIRIFILLLILIGVGLDAWLTKVRTTDWQHPLRVVVYPINGDGSKASARYIKRLDRKTFNPVARFVGQEAAKYGVPGNEPITITLGPQVDELPPVIPPPDDTLKIMWWSLKLRLWSHRVDTYEGPTPNVRIFVEYFDPEVYNSLDHSIGLEKGMIGVVKAFASRQMASRNNIIIAHELLHTVGATDKYDITNNQPIYPDGYAMPDKRPLLPQKKAEIMGGRIPLSEIEAEIPKSLGYTMIGSKTAREINWID